MTKKQCTKEQRQFFLFSMLSTSVVSVISTLITIVLFQQSLKKSRQQKAEAERKRRLQILVGSQTNVVAVGALEELKAEDWLEDVLQDEMTLVESANWKEAYLPGIQLPDKKLSYINLEGAYLSQANFERSWLRMTNFENAHLALANLAHTQSLDAKFRGAKMNASTLEGAWLKLANFERANLANANLQNAHFLRAYLKGANLLGADLRGTNLLGAKLQYANLWGAICDDETILPDGTHWTEDTDWTKFGAVLIEDYGDWYIYLHQQGLSIRQYFNSEVDMKNWLQSHNST